MKADNQTKNIKITGKKQNGFTIIELVVVIAVFMFIIGAAIGIFLSIVRNQKKILSEEEFLNQISYAEEYMSKALRMASVATDDTCISSGYIYSLTRYDSGLFKGIKFINQSDVDSSGNPACQEFFLDDTTDPSHPVLKEIINGQDAVAITSSSLQINYAKFSINGSNGDIFTSTPNNQCSETLCGANNLDIGIQPRASILLNVTIPGGSLGPVCHSNTECSAGSVCDLSAGRCVSTRTIQTTVSQRNLNIQQ